jgi:hypothetical protein
VPPVDDDARLIDLDVPADPPAATPGGRNRHRVARAAAVLALALLGTTASGRLAVPDRLSTVRVATLPAPLASGGWRSLRLSGGAVTVRSAADGAVWGLVPGSGRAWWRGDVGFASRAGGFVVVERPACEEGDTSLAVRRAADGQLVRTGSGRLLALPTDLLVVHRRAGRCLPGAEEQVEVGATAPATVEVRELASGRLIWSAEVSPGVHPAVLSRAGRQVLYAVSPDGRWLIRDVRSGAVLPPSGSPAGLDPGRPDNGGSGRPRPSNVWYLLAGPGMVFALVAETSGGTVDPATPLRRMVALDLDSLRPLWTRGGRGPLSWVSPVDCAPMSCVSDADGVQGVDRSGRTRWRREGWQMTALSGAGRAVIGVDRIDPTGGGRAVFDTATGRLLLDLTRWQVATPPYDGVPQRGLVLFRHQGGRTVVYRLDLAREPLDPVVVGWVPDDLLECAADGELLACQTLTGGIAAWRLPPRP